MNIIFSSASPLRRGRIFFSHFGGGNPKRTKVSLKRTSIMLSVCGSDSLGELHRGSKSEEEHHLSTHPGNRETHSDMDQHFQQWVSVSRSPG